MTEQPEDPDLVDAILTGLDVVADREGFLPALFAAVESYLREEIDFAPEGERVEAKERLATALVVMGQRLLAYQPAPRGEA